MRANKRLLGVALTGLVLAAGCAAGTTGSNSNSAASAQAVMGECHGVNACKGAGACGGKGHSCAGKNSCKGKGWLKLSKAECSEKGGTFKGAMM
ncbi:MAG: hypothetical protein HN353_09380 [Bdellovibrionales bacterium]|nr:hypothetical protein [Bdellovibrionales bacterium]MBT3527344.1 hypothetical protein [Bdellovibrionales bacterium]MBT7668025.1 hypothetical protein [Bdellovibrionales bacterium]MBT7766791.1 hypothetical protein [Bdellovibrionales bacterium]